MKTLRLLLLAIALAAPATADQRPRAIPARPEQIVIPPLRFDVQRAADFREVLPRSRAVVFIEEDHTLPLVSISATIRTGSFVEPIGKEGLAALTGAMMRRGGTASLDAEALDERLEMLATRLSTSIGSTSGSASLSCLSSTLDESLALFVEMLREPRFQQDRLDLAKRQLLQQLRQRNDEPADVEGREWNLLVFGASHYSNRLPTAASVQSITREDMVAFHRRYFAPERMSLAVSGAFSRAPMLQRLDAALTSPAWPAAALAEVPQVPATVAPERPAVYVIERDIDQARVSLGLPSVRRDHPDVIALEVMNEILGGSGFNSRITRIVRSNEGLAYSAGSGLWFGAWHPGTFRAALQSKSPTAVRAARLVLDEIRRIRETPVTADELETVKRSLVESFPATFASAAQRTSIFASDEYTGRDPAYWQTYRQRIEAVTAAEVQRVARVHLRPEELRVLVVGNRKDVDADASATLAGLGLEVVPLALPDPLTLERPRP